MISRGEKPRRVNINSSTGMEDVYQASFLTSASAATTTTTTTTDADNSKTPTNNNRRAHFGYHVTKRVHRKATPLQSHGGSHQNPMDKTNPVSFAVLRIPFSWSRIIAATKVGARRIGNDWKGSGAGREAFDAQKKRHQLKERGREVGIEHFNLDRKASNTLKSHQLVNG